MKAFLDGFLKRTSIDGRAQSSHPHKKTHAELDPRTLAARPDLAPHWLPQLEKGRVTPHKGGTCPGTSKVAMLDDRKVFLKCLDFTQAYSCAKRAFLDDAMWIQALEHPHIVQVLGFSVVAYSTTFCVALEFMEQGTLASCLQRPTFLTTAVASSPESPPSDNSPPETLLVYQMCLELAIGLHYLHSQHIPHTAISTAHVLVHNNQCKWNIQQLMRSRAKHCTRRGLASGDGERYGTGDVVYAAPELLSSTTQVDELAADIYALAIVFGQLATQKAPFAHVYDALGPVAGDVHIASCKANPASSPENVAPFPDWLTDDEPSNDTATTKGLSFESLVRKCLDADPAARPTIDHVVLALVPLAEKPRLMESQP